jgi:hypothetical protein
MGSAGASRTFEVRWSFPAAETYQLINDAASPLAIVPG